MAMKRNALFSTEDLHWSINFCSWVDLFWLLCAPPATLCYFGKGVDGKDPGLYNSRGDFPVPKFFLNVTSVRVEDWVMARCTLPSNVSAIRYIFYKDGLPLSAYQGRNHPASFSWPFNISYQSAGQYSCGYEYMTGNNQEKKLRISLGLNLTISSGDMVKKQSDMTRLANGSSRCTGRVEVLYNRQWGTVRDDGWDLKSAQVVCRELGCGVALTATQEAHFGRGSDPIWIDDVKCNGTETSLRECHFKKWGEHDCNHGEDAGVVCSGGEKVLFIWILRSTAVFLLLLSAPVICYILDKWSC